MTQPESNRHRTLKELVSINAWFKQDEVKKSRFTLHAGVTFTEERLGGGSEHTVTFKLAVKRCDIVFCPPLSSSFRVDASTVHSPTPLNPKTVLSKATRNSSKGGRLRLALTNRSPSLEIDGHAEVDDKKQKVIQSEQTINHYNELWKRKRGNHAWSVDGKDLSLGRLAGPVFNAHSDPRLTVTDVRSHAQREKDNENELHPVATIKVECLREDIDIYDIEFKDPERQKLFELSSHREAKLLAAREVIRQALIAEGLSAGDLANDPLAEMTICDVAINIVDESA